MNLKGIFQKQTGVSCVRRYVAQTDLERQHAELQRDLALAGIPETHPVWQAVLELVDEHAQRELDAALMPNLTNEQRQFAAGAAATADYLAQMLRDARALAGQKSRKQKAES